MPSFIARQPNGLLCRYSTIVDTVTHWNMTEEDYLSRQLDENEGKETLKNRIQSFEEVTILLNNETKQSRYDKYKEMGCSDELIDNLISGLEEEEYYCYQCRVVPIPKPVYCCSGSISSMDYFCGCMGLPIDPPYCDECWDKIKKGEDE